GDWTLQESDLVGNAVRIDQDSETFASVLQILRYHRIFGPSSLPAGQPCRKAKLPALRQALSYFQLEQVKGHGKGFKGKASRSASAWLRPESLHIPRREEVFEASSDTNSPVRWEVAVEVAL
ncbi:katG1, partial [Symbiodinium pilosum]